MTNRLFPFLSIAVISGIAVACTSEESEDGACVMDDDDCGAGLVCAEVLDGEPMCAPPVSIVGIVQNSNDDSPIEGALVQARDANGAAAGTSAVSSADGRFALEVPAMRDAEGTPLESTYTLAAQAHGFELFPSALRQALPIDTGTAEDNGDGAYVVENAVTTIELIPLAGDLSGLGSIQGTVGGEACAGVLVVAESDDTGVVGWSNSDCVYTIFNVPAGIWTVSGYAAGLQVDSVEVTVAAGAQSSGADLTASSRPLSTVSGSVNIVNAPGGSVTSVILAVESTFVEGTSLAQIPPGLRVGDVTGAFSIEGVPDGRYVVLAAYENDFLVRDPDTSIAGTDIVHITVPDPVSGNTVSLPESFKITAALDVVFPGAEGPEAVDAGALVLEWMDDSSEDYYDVVVRDALGNEIWTATADRVTGATTVTLVYDGPALEAGMYYQFKATP